MTPTLLVAAAFGGLITFLHLASVALAVWRCRPKPRMARAADGAPPVSIVRPVCGIENHIAATLGSSFTLDYPHYELLFCVASKADPIIDVVERLIAAHPGVPARLLIGDTKISPNPKLNNVVKGWRAAAHDWIVLADSNVAMPPDYVQRLLARWRPDSGLVASPPVGCDPVGFAAELECAFLNTHQARWQYAADSIGFGFAQGKTMLWQRTDLDRAGGIAALAAEVAEDAAATKLVRDAGRHVHLVDAPFGQPLGRRSLKEVWHRQLRWARLRRASFPLYFLPEILSGALPPAIAAAIVATELDHPVAVTVIGFAVLWYGAEYVLARSAGWHVSWRSPFCSLARDLLLPVLFVTGWTGTAFVWRGNAMQVARAGETR
jgi:ceramide glucosyltransferase